jgi:hypothetical protein
MSTVLVQIDDHIATVTINKPEVLNALSTAVLADLNQALDEVEKVENIYAVILTGAGEKSFVAGADISEMKDMDAKQAAQYAKFADKIFFRIEDFHCPVIAAVNGFALGGGCELAMACDIRIASETARFAQPEAGLGITPGFGGTQRLARLIGAGRAKELIYTGRHVKADEAFSIGLVNKVTKPENLMAETIAMAQVICQKAPFAIKKAKAAINRGLQVSIDKAVAVETEEFAQCFATEDQKMGMNAFVNKEKVEKFYNR